jgi:hypothetical protein
MYEAKEDLEAHRVDTKVAVLHGLLEEVHFTLPPGFDKARILSMNSTVGRRLSVSLSKHTGRGING